MGIFNSVYFKCPKCGEVQEDQFKPGSMNAWYFPEDVDTMPLDYVQFFNGRSWECYKCACVFQTDVDLKIEVSNARISIVNLDER